jgi:hypothetical protein
MKTKNSYPSSEFEQKDKCPSCGSPCDIHSDLDDNDECNDCRIFEDNLETAAIDYRDKSDDENTDEETMLINVNWYDKQEAFIAGAKWQQERSYSEEDLKEAFAIEFAEWLLIIYNEDIIYDAYTKEELLEIYKKEKAL